MKVVAETPWRRKHKFVIGSLRWFMIWEIKETYMKESL